MGVDRPLDQLNRCVRCQFTRSTDHTHLLTEEAAFNSLFKAHGAFQFSWFLTAGGITNALTRFGHFLMRQYPITRPSWPCGCANTCKPSALLMVHAARAGAAFARRNATPYHALGRSPDILRQSIKACACNAVTFCTDRRLDKQGPSKD